MKIMFSSPYPQPEPVLAEVSSCKKVGFPSPCRQELLI